MVLICVGEVTSRIKKDHVYNYKYKVGETLIYEREPRNKHSQNAVLWKTKISEWLDMLQKFLLLSFLL